MTDAILEDEVIEAKPIRYPVALAKIEELRTAYMPLTISGVDDKAGFKAVHSAHMEVRSFRVDVDKTRKELKAGALEYGRKVDSTAKALMAPLEEIEAHLKGEKDRINAEVEAAKQKVIQERINKLEAVNCRMPTSNIETLNDEAFATVLANATEAHKKQQTEEAERVANEEAERIEAERLRAEEAVRQAEAEKKLADARAKLERQQAEHAAKIKAEEDRLAKIQAEQEAAQRKIDEQAAEAARVERERLAKIEAERLAEEAAEKARIETEQRLKREAAKAEAKRQAEVAEAKRQESLRPDREKLDSVADAIDAIAIPEVRPEMARLSNQIQETLVAASRKIRLIAQQ